MAQGALPHMEPGGVIINTGSVTALRAAPALIDYSATKGAIHVFTRSLAQAVAEQRHPRELRRARAGLDAADPVHVRREHVGEFGADTLWKRPAQPAEIAPSYVFLASADSRFYSARSSRRRGGRRRAEAAAARRG